MNEEIIFYCFADYYPGSGNWYWQQILWRRRGFETGIPIREHQQRKYAGAGRINREVEGPEYG